MRVAVGFKAHSGWAALVVVAVSGNKLQVVDRRRVELVEPEEANWAKQPYHAAETLPIDKARDLIRRSIESAKRVAGREIQSLAKRLRADHEIVGCAVLTGTPMPEWLVEEILAVHFRMHKAEGLLFPDALAAAITDCKLTLRMITEKDLAELAKKPPLARLLKEVASLGKSVGPPWGADQKNATRAAIVAFGENLN